MYREMYGHIFMTSKHRTYYIAYVASQWCVLSDFWEKYSDVTGVRGIMGTYDFNK